MDRLQNRKDISQAVKSHLLDIDAKLGRQSGYFHAVNAGNPPEWQSILDYAALHVPYYASLGKGAALIDFPVMNKISLKTHAKAIFAPEYRNQPTHTMFTSGSTGIPFCVVQNLEKRDRHIADLKYFGELAGYHDHDPLCYLRAKPTATREEQQAQNIWQLDICSFDEQKLINYYGFLLEKRCTALLGYSSALETAVDFWSGHFKNETSIQTIIAVSEALQPRARQALRVFFGDACRIVVRYSNTEQGILGQESVAEGMYELNWASYIFEILQMDGDAPAAEGNPGRIVVTDLWNQVFPLIRYDTGDVAKMFRRRDGFPYLSELYGRRLDLIYDVQNRVVSPHMLGRVMRFSNEIEQWQFIQESPACYTLKITDTRGTRPRCGKEIEALRQILGAAAQIDIVYVQEIPVLNSMKRKQIVSRLNERKLDRHV